MFQRTFHQRSLAGPAAGATALPKPPSILHHIHWVPLFSAMPAAMLDAMPEICDCYARSAHNIRRIYARNMHDAGASGTDAGGIPGVVSIRLVGRLTPRYSFRVTLSRHPHEIIPWFLTRSEAAHSPVSSGSFPLRVLRTFCVNAAHTLRSLPRPALAIMRRR